MEKSFPAIAFKIINYSFPISPSDFTLDFAPGI
jgi:hypothetical protein